MECSDWLKSVFFQFQHENGFFKSESFVFFTTMTSNLLFLRKPRDLKMVSKPVLRRFSLFPTIFAGGQ